MQQIEEFQRILLLVNILLSLWDLNGLNYCDFSVTPSEEREYFKMKSNGRSCDFAFRERRRVKANAVSQL